MSAMRRRVDVAQTTIKHQAGAHPNKLRRARRFRHEPTSAEAMLWLGLRRRLLAGVKFRRQHLIAGYIVDFYCSLLRLAIEVDGGVHALQQERDQERTVHLARLGVHVVRIPNDRILADLPGVIAHLLEICERLRATTQIERETVPLSFPFRRSANASGKAPPFPRKRGKGAGG